MAAPLSRSDFLPLRKLPPGEAFLTPQAEADYNCLLFKKSYMAPKRSLPGGTFLIPTLKADYIAAYFTVGDNELRDTSIFRKIKFANSEPSYPQFA